MKKIVISIILLLIVFVGSMSVFADPIALPDENSCKVVTTHK
jgi:hypothetical protein